MNSWNEEPATALVLAAGRGERMRPLTDATPKPMLLLGGRPLMAWHLRRLAQAGHRHVVVNTAWLEERVVEGLGPFWTDPVDTSLKLAITYSKEVEDFGGALETAGGIARALPCLAEVFWVLAGDVFAPDFDFSIQGANLLGSSRARLWLVPNPAHNAKGDFGLEDERVLNWPADDPRLRLTFSTIALYHRSFFSPPVCDLPAGNVTGVKAALAPCLRRGMDLGWVSGQLYPHTWVDVGTPQRLQELRNIHG
ncbi:MAG: nucleotidyltransferase family protein [Alphaproteobacteria bacterium]|nr:nucleotidyltransferase family protein [Alphaproteobacteria bacterium]